MIEVEQLSKTFPDPARGEILAVDRMSFSARPGEIYGLLGPNGAGKTTTLRMLSTTLQPTSGTARIAGCDIVLQPAEVRRKIGFLSGTTGVYDRMTAWELVEFFGRLHGLNGKKLRERQTQLFERLQMEDFRDVLCAKMSTGMKQKVSIARTLIHDPPVLIFDEPTSGLDVLVARTLLQTIVELRAQGKCLVYSTHIMSEAQKLCDRIGIIHQGQMLAEGSWPELQARYQQPDLEELFFQLISRVRDDEPAPAGAVS